LAPLTEFEAKLERFVFVFFVPERSFRQTFIIFENQQKSLKNKNNRKHKIYNSFR